MKTIIGNWKMQVGVRESVALARGTLQALRGKKCLPEIIICPSFTALSEVRKIMARSHVRLGAQDLFWEETGAYTGEISSRMLTELDVSHVLIGHSERRQYLGETDEMIGKKMRQALQSVLTPVLCVGETAEERQQGKTQEVINHQLQMALKEAVVPFEALLFIAYEPRWSIGTGVVVTSKDVVVVHQEIRKQILALVPYLRTEHLHVLYGGSVDGSNAYTFLREKEVDGVLVGGASVKLTQMQKVFSAAIEAMEGAAHQ